jgi:PTH1 family peptidyl-tRNA hydrolase
MYLIAGLGNPGRRYETTRHNAGYLVIDSLARFFKLKAYRTEYNYEAAAVEYKDSTLVLMKPLTFMNFSGRAIVEFTNKFDIELSSILIVYDDVNLDYGTLRLKPSGSDGGQKGMHSIIYEMQSEDIPRLRLGIKNPAELEKFYDGEKYHLADYVLSSFTRDEMMNLDKVLSSARDCVLSFTEKGIEETMNVFNKNILEQDNLPH